MKDVYIRMQEELYSSDPNEYLKKVAAEYAQAQPDQSDILCPNCMKTRLTKINDDAECSGCGQSFILIGNVVRFK